MNKNLFFIGLLLMWMSFPTAAQEESVPVDGIVALVEEGVILRSELDDAISAIEQQVRAQNESLPPRKVLEEQVLDRLVLQRLQLQRAEETGIRVSDMDVDNAMRQLAEQNDLTMSQLRSMLEADNIDFEEFRREMHNEIVTSRLQQRVVDSMDDITETEIDILLASESFGSEEFLLSQIVVGVPDSASPQELEEAQARVEEIYRQLDDGMSFSAAAISYSQSADALDGGDIGWRAASALPGGFADLITRLEPGEITEPLRTGGGYVILKVRDKRERGEMMVQEYKARHILISPSELIGPEDARQKIEELHQRIEDGEDFAELARQYSSDQSTANIGGLMDWFPAGGYGPEIGAVVNTLSPGELSTPFNSARGWHLIELVDVRQSDRSEEIMRAEAREMLAEQKSQEELDRFIQELRSESFVEIRL